MRDIDSPDRGSEAIAREVARLEEGIVRLAEKYGASITYELGAPPPLPQGPTGPDALLFAARALAAKDLVVVERRRGTWVLAYQRRIFTATEVNVLLRDASLAIRRLFLDEASNFASAYRAEVERMIELRRTREVSERELAQKIDGALAILDAGAETNAAPPKQRRRFVAEVVPRPRVDKWRGI